MLQINEKPSHQMSGTNWLTVLKISPDKGPLRQAGVQTLIVYTNRNPALAQQS